MQVTIGEQAFEVPLTPAEMRLIEQNARIDKTRPKHKRVSTRIEESAAQRFLADVLVGVPSDPGVMAKWTLKGLMQRVGIEIKKAVRRCRF